MTARITFATTSALALLVLAGCAGQIKPAEINPTDMPKGPGLFSGESGNILEAFKSKSGEGGTGGSSSLGVNTYLWRATLESLSFMPITTADSAGGVIATDWYAGNKGDTNERLRVNVLILGKKLQASALQVTMFKQKKDGANWVDTEASVETTRLLEDTILTKARALRVRAMATEAK